VVAAIGVAAVATCVSLGGRRSGGYTAADPCTAAPDPRPGSGADAAIQRVVLSAVDGAACELGTSREVLVLSLDSSSPADDIEWDRPTVERALREAAHRAIDDAVARGSMSGATGALLSLAIDHLSLEELIDRLPTFG
jgi:hypothetical protein